MKRPEFIHIMDDVTSGAATCSETDKAVESRQRNRSSLLEQFTLRTSAGSALKMRICSESEAVQAFSRTTLNIGPPPSLPQPTPEFLEVKIVGSATRTISIVDQVHYPVIDSAPLEVPPDLKFSVVHMVVPRKKDWVGQVFHSAVVCRENVYSQYEGLRPNLQSAIIPQARFVNLLFSKKDFLVFCDFVLPLSVNHVLAHYGVLSSAIKKERTAYDYTHISHTIGRAYKAAIATMVSSKGSAILSGFIVIRGTAESLKRDSEGL